MPVRPIAESPEPDGVADVIRSHKRMGSTVTDRRYKITSDVFGIGFRAEALILAGCRKFSLPVGQGSLGRISRKH